MKTLNIIEYKEICDYWKPLLHSYTYILFPIRVDTFYEVHIIYFLVEHLGIFYLYNKKTLFLILILDLVCNDTINLSKFNRVPNSY